MNVELLLPILALLTRRGAVYGLTAATIILRVVGGSGDYVTAVQVTCLPRGMKRALATPDKGPKHV